MTDAAEKDAATTKEAFRAIGQIAVDWRDSYAARMVQFARDVNAHTSVTSPGVDQ